MRRLSEAWLIAALAAAVVCCRGEEVTIQPTEPEIIARADLEGEWYYMVTTLDVMGTTALTFPGETGRDMPIIRWEITENVLYARLAYSFPATPTVYGPGEVVGAWPITAHLEMGGSDCSWEECSHIQVDWSKSLITSLNVLWKRNLVVNNTSLGFLDAVSLPAPRAHRDHNGRVTYLDTVEQALIAPGDVQADHPLDTPDCYWFWGKHDCVEAQITLRHAFWKRNPDRDYQPLENFRPTTYPSGFFSSRRLDYMPDLTDTFVVNRLNLWKQSSATTDSTNLARVHAPGQCPQPSEDVPVFHCPENGGPCRCTVNDRVVFLMAEPAYEYRNVPQAVSDEEARIHARGQCPAGEATCDDTDCRCTATDEPVYKLGYNVEEIPLELAEKDGVHCPCDGQNPDSCTTPCFYKSDGSTVYFPHPGGSYRYPLRFFQRSLRQFPYYLGGDFPDSLKPSATKVIEMWSEVLEDMVWRISGCENAGGVRGTHLCSVRPEFTVDATDTETFSILVLCPNNPVEPGDPAACGPAGTKVQPGDIRYNQIVYWHKPDASSPLSYGPFATDSQTGEIRSASIHYYGSVAEPLVQRAGVSIRMLTDDDFQWRGWMYRDCDWTGSRSARFRTLPEDRLQPLPPRNHKRSDPHIDRLRDTSIEDQMMTNNMLRNRAPTLLTAGLAIEDVLGLTGHDLPYGSDLRREVSPITWLDTDHLRWLGRLKFKHFANTVMHAEFMPFSPYGGLYFAAGNRPVSLYGNYFAAGDLVRTLCADDQPLTTTEIWVQVPDCGDRILEDLRIRTYEHVAAHQLGHNLGLRHNFKGSYDVLNFEDKYWEIRVAGVINRGDIQIDQRYLQPQSEWEADQGITEHQRASLMDFSAPFVKSELKPGRWDVAAINRAYGGFVQVFDRLRDDTIDTLTKFGLIQAFSRLDWPTPIRFWITGPEAVLPTMSFYDPDNPTVTPEGIVDLREHNRVWRPEAWIRTFEISGEPVHYTDPDLEQDGTFRFIVPYLYCSDESRNSVPGCHYFDQGADLFEVTESLIAGHRTSRIVTNSQPHCYGEPWDEDGHTFRTFHRYFDTLSSLTRYAALYRAVMEQEWYADIPGEIDRFFTEDWAFFTIASARGAEFLAGLLTTTQCGIHVLEVAPDGTPVWMRIADCDYADVGDIIFGSSGFIRDEDRWATDASFRWYLKRYQIGQSYDRVLAVQLLAERHPIQTPDLGLSTEVGYSTLYGPCLLAYVGGILSNDWHAFAPRVCQKQGALPGQQSLFSEQLPLCGSNVPPCEDLQASMREANNDPTITLTWTGAYLDPGLDYTTKLNMGVFGLELIPPMHGIYPAETVDSSPFAGCNDLDLDGCLTVTFTDPFSHRTYVALRHPDEERGGSTLDISVGAKMLEYAGFLYQTLAAAEVACGRPCEPSSGGLYDTWFRARNDLQDYLVYLDLMETLTTLREQTP